MVVEFKNLISHKMKFRLLILLWAGFGLCTLTNAQEINLGEPQGIYYFATDNGTEFKLELMPKSDKLSNGKIAGKAELTLLGNEQETFYGKWEKIWYYGFIILRMPDPCPNFSFISEDGWLYDTMSDCEAENPKDRIKLRKSQQHQ